tara:strand:- start:34 stop:696 length:663 start_codon:yes stop_codon:yes gene_type:complete
VQDSDQKLRILSLDMLEEVKSKYSFINFEQKFKDFFQDWMAFQIEKQRIELLGDEVEGFNLTEVQKIYKENFVFEKSKGTYDEFTNHDKLLVKGHFITFDNVSILNNKFTEWFFNSGFLSRIFFKPRFIELRLISCVSLEEIIKKLEVRLMFNFYDKRGKQKLIEFRFLFKDDLTIYDGYTVMEQNIFGGFSESNFTADDFVVTYDFMKKFIKNTRKLLR